MSLGLFALALAASVGACFGQSARPAQARAGLSRVYPNTADGLREMLNNLLATARTTDPGRVDTLLVELEIPDSGRWFSDILGPDQGARDDDLYHRTLDDNENDFQMRIEQMARQGGEFQVRKVNDAPRGAESALLQSFRERADVYFASWKPKAGVADALPRPYFVFVDGKFRWDALLSAGRAGPESSEAPPSSSSSPQISESSILRRPPAEAPQPVAAAPGPPTRQNPPGASSAAKPPAAPTASARAPATPPVFQPLYTPPSPSAGSSQQPSSAAADTVYAAGKDGVGFPACISCPAAEYPRSAAEGLQGTVTLRVTVGVDGSASDIMLVRTDELAFIETAIAAVRNWRFKPASGPDGNAVPVSILVSVSFRIAAKPAK